MDLRIEGSIPAASRVLARLFSFPVFALRTAGGAINEGLLERGDPHNGCPAVSQRRSRELQRLCRFARICALPWVLVATPRSPRGKRRPAPNRNRLRPARGKAVLPKRCKNLPETRTIPRRSGRADRPDPGCNLRSRNLRNTARPGHASRPYPSCSAVDDRRSTRPPAADSPQAVSGNGP